MRFLVAALLVTGVLGHFELKTPQSRGVLVDHGSMAVFPCGGQSETSLAQRNVFPVENGMIMVDNAHKTSPFLVYAAPTDQVSALTNGTGQPGANQYSSGVLIASSKNYTGGSQVLSVGDISTQAASLNPGVDTAFLKPGAAVTLQVVQVGSSKQYVQCSDVILGDSSEQLLTQCLTNPASPTCATAYWPTEAVSKDLMALCVTAPYLSACSMGKQCTTPPVNSSGLGPYCEPLSLLASACSKDVPSLPANLTAGITACQNYNKLCAPGSLVKQCVNAPKILKDFIPAAQVTKQFESMCDEMPSMSGCMQCKFEPSTLASYANCDQLTVYAKMCLAMPKHTQCVDQKAMCTARPDDNLEPSVEESVYCVASSNTVTPMPTSSPVPSYGMKLGAGFLGIVAFM